MNCIQNGSCRVLLQVESGMNSARSELSGLKTHDTRRKPIGRGSESVEERKIHHLCSDAALVSVIIPCYNQGHFLGEAIESVLVQTHPHIEIIVVDDGSTDNTAEVAAGYPGVQCIRQSNRGLSAARNTGMWHSGGDYLVFLDADDRLLPDAVEAGLSCLNAHPDCAFVSGHHRYIKADGTLLREFPQEHIRGNHYLSLLQGNYIGMHATVMYRRALLESIGGFNETLAACEDYELYLRMARKFPIHCQNKVVAEYRWHDDNMSLNPELMLKTALTVLRSQWRYVKRDKRYKKAYRVGMRTWKKHYGDQLFKPVSHMCEHGKGNQAVLGMRTLLRYAPGRFAKHVYRQAIRVDYRILKAMLPVPIRRLLARCRGRPYHPPVGRVHFGDLRRVTPISRVSGYDRGLPIDRYYVETFLAHQTNDIRGRVLEIGDDSYTRKFGSEHVTTGDVLHVENGNPRATIVADLTRAGNIPSNIFDCIIFTQTLQYIYDVKSAIQTLHRILRPGGVLLATFPGVSQISIDEWADSWNWTFTGSAVQRLFEEVFPAQNIKVVAHGNVLAATAFLHGLGVEELRREELDHHDTHYLLLITLRAAKSDRAP